MLKARNVGKGIWTERDAILKDWKIIKMEFHKVGHGMNTIPTKVLQYL